jgi:hypothetical protein
VIGGLLCATIATLFFVPTVFSIVHRKGRPHSATAAGTDTDTGQPSSAPEPQPHHA